VKTLRPQVTADGVKVFHLNARATRINLGDGKVIDGMGYDGMVPGPTIDVQEGDRVKIVFTNQLDEPTTVHWHGIDVPMEADGVPGLTQPAIQPGKQFTYEFTASPAGTHFYHTHGSGTHGDEAGQMNAGLAGALIIHRRQEVKADIDVPIVLGGGVQGMYTINGAVFPHTKPLTVKTGQLVRLRFINAGSSAIHPMHVHGHQVTLDALDGNLVPKGMRMLRNTITLNAGETADVLFRAYNPGKWVIHCHDLNHVSGGMVLPFIYSDYHKGSKTGTPQVL
jgi:FtsP/CotA-like multicopper oxidase with cupredoxin domain